MTRWLALFIAICIVAGCAPRGQLGLAGAPLTEGQEVRRVFVATTRRPEGVAGDPLAAQRFGAVRDTELHLAALDISVPPGHREGRIEWPEDGTPNPARHFAVAGSARYDGSRDWLRAVDADQPTGGHEVLVFVHGYNTNHAEAAYRLAQIAQDFDAPQPVIAYSWPSAGVPGRYVYDRDSLIFARDGLERLLRELAASGTRRVLIVAHSMGSQLVMETLRQVSIAGDRRTLEGISAVALLSPDIDEDVFVSQARRIDPFPQPFVLMVSRRDRILNIAAWLVGQPYRLGSIDDPAHLAGLPVTVVDLTDLGAGGDPGGHTTAFTAPAAISLIREMAPDG